MNHQIYEEASEWLVELRTEEPDLGTRSRFGKWLSASPQHVRAYLELTGVWETVGAQNPGAPEDIEELISRARATPNVVSIEPRSGGRSNHSAKRRRTLVAVAAIILVALVGISTFYYAGRNTYTTRIGEQRSILLADGSTIDLNARSKVRVHLDDHARRIELVEGQALFRVAKDKTRPFIVFANATRVRAVGTQFDVNQRKRGVIVTVVEGSVAVFSAARDGTRVRREAPVGVLEARAPVTSSGRAEPLRREPNKAGTEIAPELEEILLHAGQQVTLLNGAPEVDIEARPLPQRADVSGATAWTQRRLIFDSTTLEDVAEEFNRNSNRPIIIDGSGLQNFHISGAFSSADPEPLLQFLRAQPGIRIVDHRDRIVVSRSE